MILFFSFKRVYKNYFITIFEKFKGKNLQKVQNIYLLKS